MIVWDDSIWDKVDDAVRACEQAWRTRKEVDLAEFVPPPSASHRLLVLSTLIKLDQERRWQLQGYRPLEDYLERWPELTEDGNLVAELLDAECRIRADHNRLPTWQELQERFPDVYARVDLLSLQKKFSFGHRTSVELTAFDSLIGSVTTACLASQRDNHHIPLTLGTTLGRFRVLGVLGRGGMGTVYLAQDDELDRMVAVKVLHPWITPENGGGSRLLEEARRAAKLKHPSIVPVYDVGRREDGSHFIVMQYVDGPSLEELIVNGGVSIRRAVAISEQVAHGLDYAHRHGLIHRDSKPANILINEDGHALLADFGLAIDRSDRRDDMDSASGTVPYMAPEQLQNDSGPIDRPTDVWAFGVVLYEMLTGGRPLVDSSSIEITQAILHEAPTPPRQLNRRIPHRLQRICLRCLSKPPNHRYATVAEVAQDLRYGRLPKNLALVAAVSLLAILLAMTTIFRSERNPQWVRPSGETDNSPISPWLDDCQLVFTANTGATVRMDAAQAILRGSPPIVWSHTIAADTSRQGDFQLIAASDSSRVRWEVPLAISSPHDRRASAVFPETCSLRLRVEITRDGRFQLGTLGDRPEEHLSLLVLPGGICNYRDFSSAFLERRLYDVPHDEIIDTDARQTVLAQFLEQLYAGLWTGQAISNGPSQAAELYLCPMSFRHRFARTISVVRARLYHQQFDYSWFREETRSFREAANVRWSPIAQHPTQECDLSFGFDLDSTTGYPSALYLRAITDGERTIDRGPNEYNESTFAAYGIRPIAGEISRRRGENSSVEINVEEGACTGRNYEVSSAQALLLNQYPTRIELTARSTYSEVWPFCNFATLGEVDIGSCQPLPTGQSLRDIRPDVWVIPPEKNQAAAQVD